MGIFQLPVSTNSKRTWVLLVFSLSLGLGLVLVLWSLWPTSNGLSQWRVSPLAGEVVMESLEGGHSSGLLKKTQSWNPLRQQIRLQEGAVVRLEAAWLSLECEGPGFLSGSSLSGERFLLRLGETRCYPLNQAQEFVASKLFIELADGRILDVVAWISQEEKNRGNPAFLGEGKSPEVSRAPEDRLRLFSELLRPLWTKCYAQYLEAEGRSPEALSLQRELQIVVVLHYDQRTWHKPQLRSAQTLPSSLRDCLLRAAEGFRVPAQDLKWLGPSFSLEIPLRLEGP